MKYLIFTMMIGLMLGGCYPEQRDVQDEVYTLAKKAYELGYRQSCADNNKPCDQYEERQAKFNTMMER